MMPVSADSPAGTNRWAASTFSFSLRGAVGDTPQVDTPAARRPTGVSFFILPQSTVRNIARVVSARSVRQWVLRCAAYRRRQRPAVVLHPNPQSPVPMTDAFVCFRVAVAVGGTSSKGSRRLFSLPVRADAKLDGLHSRPMWKASSVAVLGVEPGPWRMAGDMRGRLNALSRLAHPGKPPTREEPVKARAGSCGDRGLALRPRANRRGLH